MKKILGLVMAVAICGTIALPALAVDDNDILPDTIDQVEVPQYTKEQALQLLPNIVKWVFGFLLAVVALMIIVAAYMFVTGGGNPEQLGKAKNLLMYALIGLAIALIARGIVALLISLLDVGGSSSLPATPPGGYPFQ